MYDEIDTVLNNIKIIKKENLSIIVIQSDPKNIDHILDKTKVDYYKLFPDIAGSKDEYEKERKSETEKGTTTPAKSLTRNFSHGFTVSKQFDVDWWIMILGDIHISNLNGIKKLINKMKKSEKSIAFTRSIGQTFPDENFNFIRVQKKDSINFMPQFFITNSNLIKNGLFNDIKITNIYALEQILGDEVKRFCGSNSLNFWDVCYSICDYPYPKFIEGLHYNPDKAKLPRYIDSVINTFRKIRVSF